MTLRRLVLFIAAMLFTSGAAQAQVVRGKVMIPSVQTPDHIEVLLEKGDGQVIVRVLSDTQGNFEMRGMPTGGYDIVVRVEGYEDARMRIEVLPPNQGATIVNIPIDRKPVAAVIDPGDPVIDISELSRNYPKKALQEFEKAVEENRKGQIARAMERVQEALRLAPDFYSAHALLGNLHQKSRHYREAEKEYRIARELNPRSARPLIHLGSLFIEEAEAEAAAPRSRRLRGRILDDALDVLEEATKLDPHSTHAYYLLGVAYYKSSFFEESETNLNRALDLDARSGSTQLMLVNLYMKQEKWRTALDRLESYLNDNPKAPNRLQLEETRAKLNERLKK